MSSKKLSLFDFINDLTNNKKYLYNEMTKHAYVPFMINRGISNQPDLIMIAQEMNKASKLDKELQHDFYYHMIPAKKRYGKWAKADKSQEETLNLVVRYYGVNKTRALEYMKLLTDDNLKTMKESFNTGGSKK